MIRTLIVSGQILLAAVAIGAAAVRRQESATPEDGRKSRVITFTDPTYGIKGYYEGIHAYHRGVLTDGNEALLYFAQAATAFTRSQAHARQLYHSLVPPATKPDDLGLKPYGPE